MSKLKYIIGGLAITAMAAIAVPAGNAQKLVILHTNDTHSIIDPGYDDNLGGVLRRKALIDSVRNANANVLLVDAGDVVQGSLYFTLFGGEVEQKVMNALDYDIQILGNHEFDNGMDGLEKYLSGLKADLISSNYNFNTTNLKGLFKPYVVKEIDGKRIGFMGLNIDPVELIDSVKIAGVVYYDVVEAANLMAQYLKNIENVDKVVAISHIGYDNSRRDDPSLPAKTGDHDLAALSRGIDVIIGGHSHTEINPAKDGTPTWLVANADGKNVLVAQTGKYGRNLGEIDIDFDADTIGYRLITVTDRLDGKRDEQIVELLAPYKTPVDSIRSIKIGYAKADLMPKSGLVNWMADFIKADAKKLTSHKIDLAFANKGGVRSVIPKGDITKGSIMQTFPFDNFIVVLEVPGSMLQHTFDALAQKGDVAEASKNVSAELNFDTQKCSKVLIDGKPIDPNRTYYVATINYLANGNDGFGPLKDARWVAQSDSVVFDDMIEALEKGNSKVKNITPDNTPRLKIVSGK